LHGFHTFFADSEYHEVVDKLNSVEYCFTTLTWFNNLFNCPTRLTGACLKVSKISDTYRKYQDIFDIVDILIFSKMS